MNNQCSDKVALVTGGSRGIGKAIALQLAEAGAYVFVNYTSSSDAAEEIAAACAEFGGGEALRCNVGNKEEVVEAFGRIKEVKGHLDILVNNAGISRDGLFVRMKDEDWNTTLEVNLSGAYYCAQQAAKLMMKQRWGRIINMSSVVGQMGNIGQVPYVSSKAGVIGLTKALARELASRSITVNGIAPGFIETDMTAALNQKVQEEMLAQIPLGRFGDPKEIAGLVRFLASEDAGYITGQIIGVNGGMYM